MTAANCGQKGGEIHRATIFRILFQLVMLIILSTSVKAMAGRTTTNDIISGVTEDFVIPVEIHETEGKKFAKFGDIVPIHCCTPEQIEEYSKTTHHYCDLFTSELLTPLNEDIVYVRIDDKTAEKVFVNRTRKLFIYSHDGKLAVWRCAPTFESTNSYLAGTPIANNKGQIVSVVTARKGNLYVVTSFEGEGGYFATSSPWEVYEDTDKIIYGNRTFDTREELNEFVESLGDEGDFSNPTPVLYNTKIPRICLVAKNGRQISHTYLPNATLGAEYL